MINLAPVLSENMTVTFMDIINCSYASQLQYQKLSNFRKDGYGSHFLIYILSLYTCSLLYNHTYHNRVCSICRYQCEGDKLSPFLYYQN